MRQLATYVVFVMSFLLSACMIKGSNPVDPYESFNRRIHRFNMAVDTTLLKPSAKFYKAILPSPVRRSINNAFNNVATIPTVANDVLQADWRYAIKDSWRFFINSTFGIAGLFDIASDHFSLPPHYNDMGLTFAKWGDKKSPYLVLPLLGPSTIRDGMGALFDYTVLSPYAYINNAPIIWGLAGLRYVDLRSQWLETETLMDQALDKYAFIRDAYIQHRTFLTSGEEHQEGALYVDDNEEVGDYIDDEPTPAKN
jgi:phospholipid-binding lipoprotein MlaA